MTRDQEREDVVDDPRERTDGPEWEGSVVPGGIDVSVPSVARGYDYLLGGKEHFAADRKSVALLLEAVPDLPQLARDNRAFLRRAVRYLVGEAGIRQIIDIGSGLPTAGNVHEVAQEIAPETRVVYVDNDPIVLAHGQALLADNTTTTIITADVREPDVVFRDPETRRFIDLTKPFAVLLAGILHHLSDEEDPAGVTATIRERIPSGGYLLAANFHDSGDRRAAEVERISHEQGVTGWFRTWAEQQRYFDGMELVEPGLVAANDWRPDAETTTDSPVHGLYLGGVARKP